MSNTSLEDQTINILKNGYIPQDNKNLLTCASITALFIVSNVATYTLGITSMESNINATLDLEAKIVHDYESKIGIDHTHRNPKSVLFHKVKPSKQYSYYDKNGNIVTIN